MTVQNESGQPEIGVAKKGVRMRRTTGIRARILTTAMALFERQTVARTYVADIMRAENLTRELFYYYFSDKDSLVASVVEAYRELCLETVAAAVADADDNDTAKVQAAALAAIQLFYDETCEHSPMSRVFDELGIFRSTVSEAARYGAKVALGEDTDPEILRKTSVLIMAAIGLAEVSDPERETALGQAERLISHVLAKV